VVKRRQIVKLLALLDGPEGVGYADNFLREGFSLGDLYSVPSERLESLLLPDQLVHKILRWQHVPCLLNSPKMVRLTRRYFTVLQYTVGTRLYTEDDFLAAATIRYKKWLYLKKIHPNEKLHMPRDIYFIYVVHTLHPISYVKTCMELFGTIERPEDILSLKKYKLKTQELWRQTFGEDIDASYHYHLYHPPPRTKMVEVDIDLAQGGRNQATYFAKIKDVALSDEYIRSAIRDYINFLGLRKKLNTTGKWKEIIVPTLKQDLIWHTHMMHPLCYARECLELGGEYMDHNDFLDDDTLKVQFTKTQQKFSLPS